MNGSLPAARAPRLLLTSVRSALGLAVALIVSVGLSVLLAQLIMAPPSSDLRAMALYFTLSGAGSLVAGGIALRLADRLPGFSIRAKVFVGTLIGTAVALVNVLVGALLMFLSTTHDLPFLLVLLVFSGLVTTTFGLWVASAITRRLDVVAAGIGALAAGDFHAEISVPGGDEVAALARQVNDLARRLERAELARANVEREQRELTAAVSHDLRTPLASMRAMIEALDDRVVSSPAEISRYYANLRREVERLNRLIDDLFELSRLDAGAVHLNRQPVALQEIAAEVVDAMQAQARLAGVTLEFENGHAAPPLLIDGARLERAIANLVRNALEHTPPGGHIDVHVTAKSGWVCLAVEDDGEGIELADLPRIWTRFYRAERSRKRNAPVVDGAGLGLTIVRGVVEAHGGRVSVRSKPGRGAAFLIHLPLTDRIQD